MRLFRKTNRTEDSNRTAELIVQERAALREAQEKLRTARSSRRRDACPDEEAYRQWINDAKTAIETAEHNLSWLER